MSVPHTAQHSLRYLGPGHRIAGTHVISVLAALLDTLYQLHSTIGLWYLPLPSQGPPVRYQPYRPTIAAYAISVPDTG
eukprot:1856236-Rhodomonas_salina.1